MDWKHLLAYITGTVDQELLLCNEYLVIENRNLPNQLTGRVRLSDSERTALAMIGQKLGKKPWRTWLILSNLTPSTPGTASLWTRSLTVPSSARPQGSPRSTKSWRQVVRMA